MSIMQQSRYVFHLEQNIHSHILKIYNGTGNKTERVRIKLLMDYLNNHEQYIKKCIQEFETCHSKRELNSWFRLIPKDFEKDYSEMVKKTTMNRANDIIALALRITGKLNGMYSSMANKSNCESVKEAFKNLISGDGDRKEKLVKNLNKLKNL